jgi:CheY-like chemotaxis protein
VRNSAAVYGLTLGAVLVVSTGCFLLSPYVSPHQFSFVPANGAEVVRLAFYLVVCLVLTGLGAGFGETRRGVRHPSPPRAFPLRASPPRADAADASAVASVDGTELRGTELALREADPRTAPSATWRILVVDDNTDSALNVSLLLERSGHETRTAYDGLEAVEVAGAYKPEVVLLDIGLPWMSGYDVCRAIREQPWGRDILIVALSGWGREEDRRKSQAAGFNRHLVKPLDYPVLEKLLEAWPAV